MFIEVHGARILIFHRPKPVFFDDSVAEGSKRGATTKMIKNKGTAFPLSSC